MASPGRLFLLFMFSSLFYSILIDAATTPTPKGDDRFEKKGKFVLETIKKISTTAIPFLGLIPVHGTLISAVASLAMTVALVVLNEEKKPVLDALKLEFQNLNFKIDEYHVQQRWESWTSGAYHKPELKIDVAWIEYKALVESLIEAKTADQKKSHMDNFIQTYSKCEPAARTLNVFLKKRGTSFINELGQLLAEQVKCHEKDIRDYTMFISKLIYKANTMNQVYYNLKKITSPARVKEQADNAYNAALAMFQTHKECIARSLEYVEKDVEGMIDNKIKREELAKKVWEFLEETYDRYDWMVVAFLTKHSKHDIIVTMNKHVLAGFTEVTKGEITVAVARQVKGTHTQAGTIKQSIDSCFAKSTPGCTDVVEKLDKCKVPYTAVHVYTDKAHDSHGAEEAPFKVFANPEDPNHSTITPYIYTGKCEKSPGVHGGHFVVLIETDEELLSKDPCAKMNCGGAEKGKCVQVKNMYVALCECKYPYYGSECEETLDDYKKELEAAIP